MRRQETALANACLAGAPSRPCSAGFHDGAGPGAQEVRIPTPRPSGPILRVTGSWVTRPRIRRARRPNPGQPTQTPAAELEKILANVKLPPGFKIGIWASGVPQARQMAWGDKGTLFVGTFDKGNVHAIVDKGGKKEVKPFVTGLRMPTGVAFQDGALYVVDIDKLYNYDDPEANLDKAPQGKVVYDDFRPTCRTAGSTWCPTARAGSTSPSACPATSACRRPARPLSAASIPRRRRRDRGAGRAQQCRRRVDPRTGELWFTENARDWMSDDMPSDKLNHVSGWASISAIPYCHQGDIADPEVRQGAASAPSSRRRWSSSARTSRRSA